MSDHGYDEDFEDYAGEFESDHELEVPQQLLQQQQQDLASIAGVNAGAWPSLAALHAVHKGGQKAKAGAFTRSLVTGAGHGPAEHQGDVTFTVSPAPPPLTDSQRTSASKHLRRSLALQQQVQLSLTPTVELLALQPLSQYQQYMQGLGVYAASRVASCQTRQLGQDVQQQDTQTDEVKQQDGSCQAPDGTVDAIAIVSAVAGSNNSSHQDCSKGGSKAGRAAVRQAAAAAKLLNQGTALSDFLDWAVPEVLFELSKAAAAAEGSGVAAARQGLQFSACRIMTQLPAAATMQHTPGATLERQQQQQLLQGELQLLHPALLAGRAVIAVTCPASHAAAVAAAAAISAASAAAVAAGGVSSHLLLSCCSPAGMTATAALKEHGVPGLGCLCIWDLNAQQQQQQQRQQAPTAAGSGGLPVQVLVSEGSPTCCCWGAGAGSCLVFAGMEEGELCCWDLSEPDTAHAAQDITLGLSRRQQQQQMVLPARRPSYTAALSLSAWLCSGSSWSNEASSGESNPETKSALGVDAQTTVVSNGTGDAGLGIAAVAVLPAAASAASGGGSGAVCQLVSLTNNGLLVLYSVMLGTGGLGKLAAATAGCDLGARAGSRVWLVKLLEGLPLGLQAARPPHLRAPPAGLPSVGTASVSAQSSLAKQHPSMSAAGVTSALVVLPGPTQQLLVGVSGGRILKGALLGTPPPPREYLSAQWGHFAAPSSSSSNQHTSEVAPGDIGADSSCTSQRAVGSVTSLGFCPLCPEAWLAGHSCGSVALFSLSRSCPVLMWQQMLGASVVAVKWLPNRPCACLALARDGLLAVFDLAHNKQQPVAVVDISSPTATAAAADSISAALADRQGATPCYMEICVSSVSSTALPTAGSSDSNSTSGSSSMRLRTTNNRGARDGTVAGQGANGNSTKAVTDTVAVIGYDNGSTYVYQLAPEWCSSPKQLDIELQQLQQLLISY